EFGKLKIENSSVETAAKSKLARRNAASIGPDCDRGNCCVDVFSRRNVYCGRPHLGSSPALAQATVVWIATGFVGVVQGELSVGGGGEEPAGEEGQGKGGGSRFHGLVGLWF